MGTLGEGRILWDRDLMRQVEVANYEVVKDLGRLFRVDCSNVLMCYDGCRRIFMEDMDGSPIVEVKVMFHNQLAMLEKTNMWAKALDHMLQSMIDQAKVQLKPKLGSLNAVKNSQDNGNIATKK